MRKYIPDSWRIVKITSEEYGDVFKILASWQGGYTDPDIWKVSSGFIDLNELEDRYETNQDSGSLYILIKNNERDSSLITERFKYFTNVLSEVSSSIEYVEMEDFKKIFHGIKK